MQGNEDKAFVKLPNQILSFIIHKDERFYILHYVDSNSAKICVHDLNNHHNEITSWQHPPVQYFGHSMFVTHDSKLFVGDWASKQIIIYSLTGDVIRKVPCPPSLTMAGRVCMSSCGDDSVIISDNKAGKVVRMSLKDGSLLWSSDRVTNPSGIVHHPAGYVLVVSNEVTNTTISVLDEKDGKLIDRLNVNKTMLSF